MIMGLFSAVTERNFHVESTQATWIPRVVHVGKVDSTWKFQFVPAGKLIIITLFSKGLWWPSWIFCSFRPFNV